jgi:hypothetical protein
MASFQPHGRCLRSDLSATSDRVCLMVVSSGGNPKDFRPRLGLWWEYRGVHTQHPPWHQNVSEVGLAELSSVLRSSVLTGYDQMVSNAAKEVSDPLADIVLDARAHGRYEPERSRLTSESDLIPCIDTLVQTLSPRGSLRVTCRIRSLFHSVHSCGRARVATRVQDLQHSFLQTNFAEG